MKYLSIIVLAGMMLALTTHPAQAKYVVAGCSEQITAPIQTENIAEAELNADDYVSSYADFQTAVEYRDNCTHNTSGAAYEWNRVYEASDYLSLAAAAINSDAFHDQYKDFENRAKQIARTLLNSHISEIRKLARQIVNT